MKLKPFASQPFARVLVFANLVFWLAFTIYFVAKAYAYQPHKKVFEEVSSPYIYWSWALPFDQYMSPFMRATRMVQAPSFFAARPFLRYFDSRGTVVDQVYWGVSVGGYYLLLVVAISFVQWYLVGFSFDNVRSWVTRKT